MTIDALKDDVWAALVDRRSIKKFMFGADVNSDWKTGSSITWRGEWKGKRYEDRGAVLEAEPGLALRYTHVSSAQGAEKPEVLHTVSIELKEEGQRTRVALAQDNNATEEEKGNAEVNWGQMLGALKALVEASPGGHRD